MAGNRAAVTSRTMSLCSLKKKESPRIISAEAPRSRNWSSAGPIASRLSASAVSTSTPSVAAAFLIDANCSSLLGLRGFRSTPTRIMSGNASFNRPRRLVWSSSDSDANPVMLPSGRASGCRSFDQHDVDGQPNQFGGEFWQSVGVARSRAKFKDQIMPFNISEPAHLLTECCDQRVRKFPTWCKDADARRPTRRLRPCRQRPHYRRAAKERDEFATVHRPMPPVLPTERIAHLGTVDCCIHPPAQYETIAVTRPIISSKEVAQKQATPFPPLGPPHRQKSFLTKFPGMGPG